MESKFKSASKIYTERQLLETMRETIIGVDVQYPNHILGNIPLKTTTTKPDVQQNTLAMVIYNV